MNTLLKLIIGSFLSLAVLVAPGLAQPAGQPIVVKGKIDQDQTGFYIQGEAPPEIFTITNQDKEILRGLAKSGKSVSIDAHIVQGDALFIDAIDGKPYKGKIH